MFSTEDYHYIDPLYRYSLEIPQGWYILPTPSDAVYGSAVLFNYDPNASEISGETPADGLKVQIGVAPLVAGQNFNDWVTKWIDFQVNGDSGKANNVHVSRLDPITVGKYPGMKSVFLNPFSSSTLEIDMLLNNDQVMTVGLTPADSPDVNEFLQILESAKPGSFVRFDDQVNRIAQVWAQLPNPLLPFESLVIFAPAAGCNFGTFPGGEAPNSPISLYMPFQSGETWVVGGAGSFYGNGYHCNAYSDYYATDWNLSSGDDYGRAVLPIANGTVTGSQSPTCPSTGWGCYVQVDHDSGIRTLYAHLSGVSRTSGSVFHYDQIGSVGSTGNSTGSHLHLKFQKNDGGYFSYCWNGGSTCPNGDTPHSPQSPKPSPMNTAGGSVNLEDGHSYTSNNSNDVQGNVRLYDFTNYGGSYTWVNDPGLYTMESNFNDLARSIQMPGEWSVRLFKNNDYYGPQVCLRDNNSSLWDNYYSDGTVAANSATWFEVYNQSDCPTIGIVQLYDGTNYGGSSQYTTSPGLYTLEGDFNDKVKSIQMTIGWSVRLFKDNDYYGPQVCIRGNNSSLWDNSYDDSTVAANSATWYEVYTQSDCPTISPRRVRLFDSPDFAGGYIYVNDPGLYSLESGFNDQTKSIKMPSVWSVRLFKDNDYYGPEVCIRGSDAALSDNSYSDGSTAANSATWFEVYNQSDCPTIPPRKVRLYDIQGFTGDYYYVNDPGLYSLVSDFNDRIELVKMPNGWSVRLFKDNDYYGPEVCISGTDSSLWNNTYSDGNVAADSATLVEVYDQSDCPTISPRKVRLFDGTDFSGDYIYVNVPDLYTLEGVFGDLTKSIKMPSGWSVRLFKDNNYYGPEVCIRADNSTLWNDTYSDGSTAANDATWFEVYNQPNCSQINYPEPNLTPFTPIGWDHPIVPSSVQGTNSVNTLYFNQTTYIDWAVINNGLANVVDRFYSCLYFDDAERNCWYTDGLDVDYYAYVLDWQLDISPSVGWHTLRIVADVYDDVAESDETDNDWEASFFWEELSNCDAIIASFDAVYKGASIYSSTPTVAAFMPPHPDLLKRVRAHQASLPDFITSPLVRAQKKIDQPNSLSMDLTGQWKGLAILVDFTDNPSQVGASSFDHLIFDSGSGTVRDYYNKVSYGLLDIITVNLPSNLGWCLMPQSYAYYTNGNYGTGGYPRNAQKLAEDAVWVVNPYIDFSQYDNDGDGAVDTLFVVHAGMGAEVTGSPDDIWSHSWQTHNSPLVDGVQVSSYTTEPEFWINPGDMTLGVYATSSVTPLDCPIFTIPTIRLKGLAPGA